MSLAVVAQMTVRVSGVVLLVLGVIFWTGNLDSLHLVHILLGLLLVLGLWTLALLAARARVAIGLAVLGFAWGVIATVLGLTQINLIVGGGHWVIQVIHLLVGVGAIGIAELLAMRIKSAAPAPAKAA